MSKRAETSESEIFEGEERVSIKDQTSNREDFPEAYATSYFESPIHFDPEMTVDDEPDGNISDDISEYGSTAEKDPKGIQNRNTGMS